jgi:hypothetical protein
MEKAIRQFNQIAQTIIILVVLIMPRVAEV